MYQLQSCGCGVQRKDMCIWCCHSETEILDHRYCSYGREIPYFSMYSSHFFFNFFFYLHVVFCWWFFFASQCMFYMVINFLSISLAKKAVHGKHETIQLLHFCIDVYVQSIKSTNEYIRKHLTALYNIKVFNIVCSILKFAIVLWLYHMIGIFELRK